MRRALQTVDGVLSAEVSYDTRLARVRYRPERATPAEMIEAVIAAGFGASRLQEDSSDG